MKTPNPMTTQNTTADSITLCVLRQVTAKLTVCVKICPDEGASLAITYLQSFNSSTVWTLDYARLPRIAEHLARIAKPRYVDVATECRALNEIAEMNS